MAGANARSETKVFGVQEMENTVTLQKGDALILIDVQSDFLPGGALPVPLGNEIIPVLNSYILEFEKRNLPVIGTRDWHPENHSSFQAQGGLWPPHCVQNTEGAQFPRKLHIPEGAYIVSKATSPDKEAYSGFEGTDLRDYLRRIRVNRLYIGGLATDYCVLNTVKDALKFGYHVVLLLDAIRAVNVNPGDGMAAEKEMIRLGAKPVTLQDVR